MKRGVLASFATACLAACAGHVPQAENGAPLATLVVRAVEWNPTHVALPDVRAVVDDGNVTVVLADGGASVLSSGAQVLRDESTKNGIAGAIVPGADGSARWIVAIDDAGHPRYLHNLATFEDVSVRYGLARDRVHRVVPFGKAGVAFLLDHEIAIARDHRVTRYATEPLIDLVGGNGVLVGVAKEGIQVIHPVDSSVLAYALPGVLHAAVASDGRVYASTARALYAGDGRGALSRVFTTSGPSLHGLVASGEHVWFADGSELGLVEQESVAETRGANLGLAGSLSPSASGDVWLVEGGTLRRFQALGTSAIVPPDWSTTLAPVFARACAECHVDGGPGRLDLSTDRAWTAHRAAILARVSSRTMPPRGHALSDSDRAVIEAWGAR